MAISSNILPFLVNSNSHLLLLIWQPLGWITKVSQFHYLAEYFNRSTPEIYYSMSRWSYWRSPGRNCSCCALSSGACRWNRRHCSSSPLPIPPRPTSLHLSIIRPGAWSTDRRAVAARRPVRSNRIWGCYRRSPGGSVDYKSTRPSSPVTRPSFSLNQVFYNYYQYWFPVLFYRNFIRVSQMVSAFESKHFTRQKLHTQHYDSVLSPRVI